RRRQGAGLLPRPGRDLREGAGGEHRSESGESGRAHKNLLTTPTPQLQVEYGSANHISLFRSALTSLPCGGLVVPVRQRSGRNAARQGTRVTVASSCGSVVAAAAAR